METQWFEGAKITRASFPESWQGRGEPPNAYIISGTPALVIDTGFKSATSEESFRGAMDLAGIGPGDIGAVLISHWHWDHTGLLEWLAEHTDAILLAHPAEFSRLSGEPGETAALARASERFLIRHGFGSETASCVISLAFDHALCRIPIERLRPVRDGDTLEYGGTALTVLHTPGHTPGSICLHEKHRGLLFSSDTIYGRLFPHPVAEIAYPENETTSVLASYPAVLDRLRALKAVVCLPGHGSVFSPAEKVASSIAAFIDRRRARLLRLLKAEHKPLSAAEILSRFFPSIPAGEIFHAVAEIILLIETVEAEGLTIRSESNDGTWVFSTVS
jgi:glyoxylase-like metal-dependent hydrolase (beta-lactamase superfamily II)